MTKKETTVSKETDLQQDNQEIKAVEETCCEIDYEIVSSGPLYVNPRIKQPGFEYCFVADRPGEIEMYKRWGYSIVQDDLKVGQELASTTTKFGSAVTVQSKCGTLLVLMKIKKENHDKLMAYRAKKSKEQQQALGKIDNVPEEFQYLGEMKITKN